MKKVLFTWELGGGLGHIIPIRSLAEQFLAMGHEVYVAMMDLTHAASVFSGMNVKFLQAPFKSGYRSNPILPPMSFSQLLNNNGFSSKSELEGFVQSWRTLFELVQPDVICFDHSPSALVAARNFNCVKVTIGVGFSSPPPATPLGVFSDTALNIKKMTDDDKFILKNINDVLKSIGSDPLQSLDQLLYDGIKTTFLSLPEFDHFQARDESMYYGPVLSESGVKPKWPKKHKKKVYVYVKQFPGIVQLFKLFAKFPISFIVYTNNVPDNVLASCKASNVCYQKEPLDLSLVSKEVDLAIVNAGHSTMCQFVLAGVPVLMVPLQMEQQMLAVRMYEQKVGWIGDTESRDFIQGVERMLAGISNGLVVQKDICKKYSKSNFSRRHIELCDEIIALT